MRSASESTTSAQNQHKGRLREDGERPGLWNAVKGAIVSPPEKDRHNNINVIRLIAATIVIYGHMYSLLGLEQPMIYHDGVGAFAVRIFFVLSGFLICTSYLHDSNAKHFLVKRVARIFPGLIAVVVVSTFVLGPLLTTLPLGEYFASAATWAYLENGILYTQPNLPGVFEDAAIPVFNGSLWTIPIEFSMYLILLALFKIAAKSRFAPVLIDAAFVASAAALIAWPVLFPDASVVIYGTDWVDALMYIPYFFAGAVYALHKDKIRLSLQVSVFLLIMLSCLGIQSRVLWNVLGILILPYVFLSMSFAAPAVFGRVFAVNDFSYGTYLWAWPVQQSVILLVGPQALPPTAFFIICTLVTYACAVLSWYLVEKPGQDLAKRIIKRMKSQ